MTEQLTGTAGVLGVVVAMGTATIAVIVVVVALVLVAAAFIVRAGAIELARREADARDDVPATVASPAPAGSPSSSSEPAGPVRYGVSLTHRDREPTRYLVVTSAGSKRAASIAFERDGAASDRVRDVRVEALGPVALGPDGTPDMDAGDLFDRSEY